MQKFTKFALAFVLGLVAVVAKADTKMLYSWESPEGTVIEQGGTIAYVNGENLADSTKASRLNYQNAGYYTICLNGKKQNLADTIPSSNAGHMEVAFNEALKAGDIISLTCYYNKGEEKNVSAWLVFETGTTAASARCTADVALGAQPMVIDVTVPAEADGSKTLTMTRNDAGTNLFITKLEIKGEREGAAGWDGTVTTSFDGVVTKLEDLNNLTLTFPGASSIAILDEEDCQYMVLQNADGSEMYGLWAPTMGSEYTIDGNKITLDGFMPYEGATIAIPAGTTKLYIEDYGTLVIDGKSDYLETMEFAANIAAASEPFMLAGIANNGVAGNMLSAVEASESGVSYQFNVTADRALSAGTAVPTLSLNGEEKFGAASVLAFGSEEAYIRFMTLQQPFFTEPGTYTLAIPEGTFVDENGTPNAAAYASWAVIQGAEVGSFPVVAVYNGTDVKDGQTVEALSYNFVINTANNVVALHEGNITLTDAAGQQVGGNAYVYGYEGEGGANTVYARFNFDSEDHMLHTPGTYTLTVPAGMFKDAEGNLSEAITASWTVAAASAVTDFAADFTSNVTFVAGEKSYLSDTIIIAGEKYPAYKIGTSKQGGSCSVVLPAGTTHFAFHAIGWSKSDNTPLHIEGAGINADVIAGTGNISNNSPYTFDVDNYDPTAPYFSYEFEAPVADSAVVTFSADYRVVFYGVHAEGTAAEVSTFAITSATNAGNEPGEVDVLSYMFAIEAANAIVGLHEGNITLTDAAGQPVGGNAYVYGYEGEAGANTVYARFNFDTEDHQLHTPGEYTLNVPAGMFVDAAGNLSEEFSAVWTVKEAESTVINIEHVEIATVEDNSWGTNDVYYTATVSFAKPAGAVYAYSEGLHMELNGENTGVPFQFGQFGMIELDSTDVVTLVYKDNMIAKTDDPSYEGDIRPAGSYVATTEIAFMDADYLELPVVAKYTGSVVLPSLNTVALGTPVFNVDEDPFYGLITMGDFEANGLYMSFPEAEGITPDMQIKVVAKLSTVVPSFGVGGAGEDTGFGAPEFQVVMDSVEFVGDAMFGPAVVRFTEFAQYIAEAGPSAYMVEVSSIEVAGNSGVVASWTPNLEEGEILGTLFEVAEEAFAIRDVLNAGNPAGEVEAVNYQFTVLFNKVGDIAANYEVVPTLTFGEEVINGSVMPIDEETFAVRFMKQENYTAAGDYTLTIPAGAFVWADQFESEEFTATWTVVDNTPIAAEPRTWDFTHVYGTEAQDEMVNAPEYWGNESKGRLFYLVAANDEELQGANGPLSVTSGLFFTVDPSKLLIGATSTANPYMQIGGNGYKIRIPECAAGDTIVAVMCCATKNKVTSLRSESFVQNIDSVGTSKTTCTAIVNADGDVVMTTGTDIRLYSLEVRPAAPSNSFAILAATNAGNEPGEVDVLSYMFTIEAANAIVGLHEGNITLTDAAGQQVGGNAYVYGYEGEAGANTVYARFMFDSDDHQLHTPGEYTLNVPAGMFVDAEGKLSEAYSAAWTVKEAESLEINIEHVEIATVEDNSWGTNDVYYTATVSFAKPAGAVYAYSEGLHMELNGENTGVPFQFGQFGMIELDSTDVVTLVYKDQMLAATDDPYYEGDIRAAGSYVGTTEIYFMDENYMELPVVAKYTGSIVLPSLVEVALGTPVFNVDEDPFYGLIEMNTLEANGLYMSFPEATGITPDMQIKVVAKLSTIVPGYGVGGAGEDTGFGAPEFQVVMDSVEFVGDAMFGAPQVFLTEFAQYISEAGANAYMVEVSSMEVVGATGVVASWTPNYDEGEILGTLFEVTEAYVIENVTATVGCSEANEWGDQFYTVTLTVAADELAGLGVAKAYCPEGIKFVNYLEDEPWVEEFSFMPVALDGVEVADEQDVVIVCKDYMPGATTDASYEGELRAAAENLEAMAVIVLCDQYDREICTAQFRGLVTLSKDVFTGLTKVQFNVTEVIYNLNGQRVSKANGIVIKNGVKMLQK